MILVTIINLVSLKDENGQLIAKLKTSIRQTLARAIPALDRKGEKVVFSFCGQASSIAKHEPVCIKVEGLSSDLEIQGDLKEEIEDAFKAVLKEAFSLPKQREVGVLVYRPETYFS